MITKSSRKIEEKCHHPADDDQNLYENLKKLSSLTKPRQSNPKIAQKKDPAKCRIHLK